MSTKNRKCMNTFQKAAHKPGEHRVRREEIERLLLLSTSDDPREREEAADNLCPCHVRRRIEAVWDALYRMMEDEDVRVRRAAWHTLEDGGCPEDPRFETILERAERHETDTQVCRFVEMFATRRREREAMRFNLSGRSAYLTRGKCDFCGAVNVPVRDEQSTEIPTHDGARFSQVCETCDHVRT